MGLEETDSPLIGMITRLTIQKGLDILSESIRGLMELDLQLLILGEGEEVYKKLLRDISKRYPKKVALNIGFDPILARKIYAGSDFFLMPSKYEPCGLGQMISLRYGTIPIVRKTGGLADTIREFSKRGTGNGFLFKGYSAMALLKAVKKAIRFYDDKDLWRIVLANAMLSDFSWEASAKRYLALYKKAIKRVA